MNFIEKYQTLISGIITLLAAFIAVRPVYRQVGLMSRQTAALIKPTLIENLERKVISANEFQQLSCVIPEITHAMSMSEREWDEKTFSNLGDLFNLMYDIMTKKRQYQS